MRMVLAHYIWCALMVHVGASKVRRVASRSPTNSSAKENIWQQPSSPPPMSDHLIFDLVCPRRPRRFGCAAFAVTPSVGISGSSAILPKGKCVDLLASISL